MKIAVILLNYNGKEDTKQCLLSLAASSYRDFYVVIVDNGSSDGSVEWLREKFPETPLLANRENLGFAEGNNIGIEYALKRGCDAILLLNNDVIVDTEMLACFAQGSLAFPNAILGGKVFCFDDRQKLDHIGGIWEKERLQYDLIGFRKCGEKELNKPIKLDYVYGCAMFIPKAILETVGKLEPKFFLYWEEADYCERAKSLGFSIWFYPDAKLWHKGSASIVQPTAPKAYFFWRNRLFWLKRNYKPLRYIWTWITKLSLYSLRLLGRLVYYELYIAFSRCFFPKRLTLSRLIRQKTIRASAMGLFDFCRGKFGQGPIWIYHPISEP